MVTLPDIIYIDGVKHRVITRSNGTFHVDHPDMPGHPCAQHRLDPASVMHLRTGGAVRTGGHRYSLWPDPK